MKRTFTCDISQSVMNQIDARCHLTHRTRNQELCHVLNFALTQWDHTFRPPPPKDESRIKTALWIDQVLLLGISDLAKKCDFTRSRMINILLQFALDRIAEREREMQQKMVYLSTRD